MSEMLSNAPPIRAKSTVLLLRTRADLLARTGRWQEAAKDIGTVIESEPGNYEDYHVLAPVLIAQHDSNALRMLCGQIIKQFKGATNVHITGRMAKPSAGDPGPAEPGQYRVGSALGLDVDLTRTTATGVRDLLGCTAQ